MNILLKIQQQLKLTLLAFTVRGNILVYGRFLFLTRRFHQIHQHKASPTRKTRLPFRGFISGIQGIGQFLDDVNRLRRVDLTC